MTKRTRISRRGSAALEVLLITPIVVGLTLAVVELSMLSAANEQLANASREGTRVAALGGGPNEIIQAVQNHLGQGNLSTAQISAILTQQQDGTPIVTALTDNNGQPINQSSSGNGQSSNGQAQPIPSGEPVMVNVQTPASNAIPDLLTFIGFSIKSQTLIGQTIMRKE